MDDTFNKLLKFSAQIPAMHEGFKNAGFLVPDMMLSHIESIRPRGPQEKSYAYYKLERIRERMGFWGMDVSVSTTSYRENRRYSRYHSEYISWLIDTLDSGGFSLPQTGSYEAAVLLNFDPNEIRGYQLAFEDFDTHSQYIQSIKKQLAQEIKLYQPAIDKFGQAPEKITIGKVRELLDGILLPLGFEPYGIKKLRGRILHRKLLDDDLIVWHEYTDHPGMSLGGGDWSIFLYLTPPETTVEELNSAQRTWKYFTEGMLPFLFTGNQYYSRQHGGDWNKIVFGALAHAKMLELFFQHWEIARSLYSN